MLIPVFVLPKLFFSFQVMKSFCVYFHMILSPLAARLYRTGVIQVQCWDFFPDGQVSNSQMAMTGSLMETTQGAVVLGPRHLSTARPLYVLFVSVPTHWCFHPSKMCVVIRSLFLKSLSRINWKMFRGDAPLWSIKDDSCQGERCFFRRGLEKKDN